MPTETGESLATDVRESYTRLAAASSELNFASDGLKKEVDRLGQALKRLNLGVSAWVPIQGNDDHQTGHYWSEDLGYTRVGRNWGIALRTTSGNYNHPDSEDAEIWLFNDAPRRLRIAGVDRLPALFQQLTSEAERVKKEIETKSLRARELAAAIADSPKDAPADRPRNTPPTKKAAR
jgi:hypothetical protein